MAFLEIRDLEAFYGRARSLQCISVDVDAGTIAGIIGPNGAGKSTLLDSILGLTATAGDIRLDGVSLTGKRPADIVRLGIGYAPERGHLFPFLTTRDNLLVGAHTAAADVQRNLRMVFDLFPVLEQRQRQETATQSGCERRMVSLGRALMSSPRLLVVDEPTIGLAPKVCSEIADALRRMNRELGLTILLTEQNVNFATHLAGDIHVLETGRIRLRGTAAELENNAYVRQAYFGG